MGAHIIVSGKSTSGRTLVEILAAGAVVLYGHHSQLTMPEDLRRGLAHRQRWNDAPFLTRDEFLDGDNGFTGFGIGVELDDNDVPIMLVDVPRQLVLQFNSWSAGARPVGGWTFNFYSRLTEASYGAQFNADADPIEIKDGTYPAAPETSSAPR